MLKFLVRHKFGLLGTFLLHIFILLFAMYSYMPVQVDEREDLLVINFPVDPEVIEPDREESDSQNKRSNNNSNKAVNEAAPENVKKGDYNEYNREPSKSSKEEYEKKIEEELRELEKQVVQEQRDKGYGYSDEEIEKMLNSKKNKSLDKVVEQKPRSESAYEGSTNIKYKLENRYDTRLNVPVYMCQYGGTVVVNIAVDREGKVVSAKVDLESSKTSDPCLVKAALAGAKATRFNRKSSAPKIQMGSITYQFIEQ